MTIGRSRRHKSASVKRSFTMTDKQKARMHEAAQLQLFQMSDVQGELHNKHPPAASRKRRAAERAQDCVSAGAHDQPQVRCKRRNIRLEEKASVKQKAKNIDNELKEEERNASGRFDHLLILANSAELMESEGKCYTEKPPDTTQDYGGTETEKSSLRVRGRVRLTQIRHRARLENSQQIHNTNVGEIHEHANLKLCEDTNGCKSVDTNQVQATDHQNDQDTNGCKSVDTNQVQATNQQNDQDTNGCKSVDTNQVQATYHQNDHGTINDTNGCKSVDTNQVQETDHQNDQDTNGCKSVDTNQVQATDHQNNQDTNGCKSVDTNQVQATDHQNDHGTINDTNGCKSVDTNQVQATDHQNDQDPHVLAKNGNTGIADIRLPAFESESVKVNNETLEQSVQCHLIISQPALMTAEHGKFTEKQSDEHQLRIANTNDPLKAHFLNEKQEHRHTPLSFRTELSASPIKKSEAAKVRRSIARERRKLRVFERRKQRHDSHFQWLYCMHMRQVFETHRWWLWHAMNATGELSDVAQHHKSLYTSYVAKEQRRVSARQRRAQKIEEKRAWKKMHRPLNNPRPLECYSKDVPYNSNVGTGVERTAIPTEEHATIAIVSEDKCGKLQQQTTNVDCEEQTSPIGQIRLTQLKREVRLKHSAVEKFTQQMDKGDESTSS